MPPSGCSLNDCIIREMNLRISAILLRKICFYARKSLSLQSFWNENKYFEEWITCHLEKNYCLWGALASSR